MSCPSASRVSLIRDCSWVELEEVEENKWRSAREGGVENVLSQVDRSWIIWWRVGGAAGVTCCCCCWSDN